MKYNYQLETDKVTEKLGESRPGLLLQCCCGPCGSYVLEYLCSFFDVTVLFFNPNIFPAEEYDKRLFWLKKVVERYDGKVVLADCAYEPERFDAIAEGMENEPEGGKRCTECFRLRLWETARKAKEGGFDFFCTTLSVSPHKDAERINAIGFELGKEFGVKWLPSDFKKRGGYKRSVELSEMYGLYRQNYCGCRYSIKDT